VSAIPDRVLALRGWTREAVERLGLGYERERVTFPVRDGSGELLGFVRYSPNGGVPKMRADTGTTRELFPPPETIDLEEGDGWLWLVEGEPDCVLAWSLGLAAVAVPGAAIWRAEWAQRFTRRRVAVCFDVDEAGREGAARAAADLAAAGIDARLVDLTPFADAREGFDLTDFAAKADGIDTRAEARRLLVRIAEDAPLAVPAGEERVVAPERIVPPPSNPLAVARMFRDECFADADRDGLLRHFRGSFYAWSGSCWPEAEERRVRADLYRWLGPAHYIKATKNESGELAPFEPTRRKVADIAEALEAITHLDASVVAPAWIDAGRGWSEQTPRPNAHEIVAMANGLLHLPTRTLLPHTPAFFTQHSLPFAFNPSAGEPKRWLRFLRELWDDDRESIDTLAETCGYILSPDTSQQKILMIVGPRRSGKGTIARVFTGLLGAHNVAGPTLAGLTSNFGLSPLIDKPLAIVSDARLGSRVDGLVAVERLLSISGEDAITVDRKYRDPWTGQLPTRFLILTNELPRFTDSSGALASRFVLLTLTRSFYGREDPVLTEALLAEAPGIFNWALAGRDRLLRRGHFLQPESAREALRHLEDLSSPVGAFVRDRCELGPAYEVDKDVLYAAWRAWCSEEGRERPGTKAMFFRDLRAAVPGVRPSRPREGELRRNVVLGVRVSQTNSGGNP
jgi:putative DNA primase/helicase